MKLCRLEDIPEGGSIVVAVGEECLALFKVKGEVFALDNSCPHMGGPLGEGECEKGIVSCPWHGWQFSITSGECINSPGTDAIKVPVFVKEGIVYKAE